MSFLEISTQADLQLPPTLPLKYFLSLEILQISYMKCSFLKYGLAFSFTVYRLFSNIAQQISFLIFLLQRNCPFYHSYLLIQFYVFSQYLSLLYIAYYITYIMHRWIELDKKYRHIYRQIDLQIYMYIYIKQLYFYLFFSFLTKRAGLFFLFHSQAYPLFFEECLMLNKYLLNKSLNIEQRNESFSSTCLSENNFN